MYKKRTVIIAVILTALIASAATRTADRFLLSGENGNLLRAKQIITEKYVTPLSKEQVTKMEDAAISAMVESLNDPYSRYLNSEGFAEYEESNEEEYVGIGIAITFNIESEEMVVTSPYEGEPAQLAGVLPGDIITFVDKMAVNAESYNSIVDYIRTGKEGEMVTLTVKRNENELEIPIERKKIVVETISHKMFEEGIGYIRISQFIEHTAADFEEALTDLKERDMKSLIIDLRSNPGGYAHTVLSISDMLLPKGTIAYLEDNKGERQYFNSDAKCLDVPMAVLINRGTASASELLAGSLKAYELATVIGEKSFGKAVGQSPYTLIPSKTAIYLTDARYFTPKGECIDGVGIEPDIKAELSDELLVKLNLLSVSEDTQLSIAIEEMKKQMAEKN